ncbi:MAG: ATP-binding protein, partial [Anaerolineales bacterium]
MTSRPAAPPRPTTQLPPSIQIGQDKFVPPPVSRIEETGLTEYTLVELALKTLYSSGTLSGYRLSELMALPFTGLVDQILEYLKTQKLVEVKGAGGLGEGAYQYAITGAGIARAREAMDRNQYAGPAPVPVNVYNEAIRRQATARPSVTPRVIRQVLSDLVISEKAFTRIGP